MTTSNQDGNVKDCVLAFIINEKDEVLLYRRINTWYFPNKLALVGGMVDLGETIQEAAVREVREETTLELDLDKIVFLTFTTSLGADGDTYKAHYFLAKNFSGTAKNTEHDRCAELIWHPINNLPDDTIPIIRTIAKKYVTPR